METSFSHKVLVVVVIALVIIAYSSTTKTVGGSDRRPMAMASR